MKTTHHSTRLNKVASESGHYYWPDGRTAYTIIGKNGKERPTTLRDAKTLGLLPSVTEVLKMLPKPGLISWQKRQVLMSALTLTRLQDEPDDTYIARILADSDEQARIAREKGTAIHGAIERYMFGQSVSKEYMIYVRAVIDALYKYFSDHFLLGMSILTDYYYEPEKSFANVGLGYGGKVDLHNQDLRIILDFKTKEFSEETDKLTYPEHVIQLEAYRHGLEMPDDARILNVFVSTSNPGLVRVVEHEHNPKHWQTFLACLELWRKLKYD
jgi:hypothetical protein